MFIDDDNFSEVVDCVLYRYNYKDSLIWQKIKSTEDYKKIGGSSILVGVNTLKNVLISEFAQDIDIIESMSTDILHKEATSVHFLWNMLKYMKNLRWVKINLNHNVAYNRVVQIDDMPTIRWSVKVLRGSLYTYQMFSPQQLSFVNQILRRSRIMEHDQHFTLIRLSDLINRLEVFIESYNTSEVDSVIAPFIQHLTPYESDNPEILLVTDE